jgi:putative SOS response-associated peptidase YedK
MCGRYDLSKTPADIRAYFDVADVPRFEPNSDIRPTDLAPIIRLDERGRRECTPMRWGLVPSWAKHARIASKLFNARAETVDTLPSFRSAFRKKRCLVRASSFWEWKPLPDGGKCKFRIGVIGSQLFAFAGLHEWWRSPNGEVLLSFTIITCPANDLIRPIHSKNRMPVILEPEHYDRWLDPSQQSARALLQPYPPEKMFAQPT